MYVGNNATAIRSQKWIVDSLLSLMEQKPYAEITVRDICRSADLSRQTFYNVFDSKDEVLCFHLRNEYQRQFARFCNNESISVAEIVETFTTVLLEDERVLSLTLIITYNLLMKSNSFINKKKYLLSINKYC